MTRRSCCYATSVLTYVNRSCSNLGPLASDLPLFNHFKCFYWVWLSVGAVVCPTVLNPLSESSAAIIGGAQSTIEEGSGGEKDIALALTADNQPAIHTIGIHGFLFKFIHDMFLKGIRYEIHGFQYGNPRLTTLCPTMPGLEPGHAISTISADIASGVRDLELPTRAMLNPSPMDFKPWWFIVMILNILYIPFNCYLTSYPTKRVSAAGGKFFAEHV